jgi:hypothetical protein
VASHRATEPPWLLIILRDRPALSWIDGDIGHVFTVGDVLFEGVVEAELTGFYDRIYGPDGHFVGVQVAPVRAPGLAGHAARFKYVQTPHALLMQLFFARHIPRDVTVGSEQAFGGRIYRSLGGEMALTIDTYFLEPDERRVISSADADWVEVEALPD